MEKYKSMVSKLFEAILHNRLADCYARKMWDETTRVWITVEKGRGAKELITPDEANEVLSGVELGPEKTDITVACANHSDNPFGEWCVDERARWHVKPDVETRSPTILDPNNVSRADIDRMEVLNRRDSAWYEIPSWLKEQRKPTHQELLEVSMSRATRDASLDPSGDVGRVVATVVQDVQENSEVRSRMFQETKYPWL